MSSMSVISVIKFRTGRLDSIGKLEGNDGKREPLTQLLSLLSVGAGGECVTGPECRSQPSFFSWPHMVALAVAQSLDICMVSYQMTFSPPLVQP